MFLSFAHRSKFALIRKVVSLMMTFTFLTSLSSPAGAQLASLLPAPGSAVTISPVFVPPTLKGLNIHPENPFLFDFIVGRGDDKIQGEALKAESEKLVKFFLTAMTIPDKEAWVNLSPYEANRIIPDALGKTEMGKVMLEQDYLLKQLASSLTNPDTDLGKKFWSNVRTKAKEKFGTTEIPMSTFNKVWIVPAKAEVAEKDGKVFITQNRLKVMLEEDYQALDSQRAVGRDAGAPATAQAMQKTLDAGRSTLEKTTNVQPPTSSLSSEVFRSTILPSIEKEINEGKNFAAVRQIYDAAILAVWYKSALKESLLGKIYADKSKVKGIETDAVGFKEEVYKQYVEAFKKGAYNMIKEDFDMSKDESVPTRYFSGGVVMPDAVGSSGFVTPEEVNDPNNVVAEAQLGETGRGDVSEIAAKAAASQSAASAVEVKLDTRTIKTVFEGVRTNSNWKLQVIVNSGGTSLLEVVGKKREIFGDLPADLNINDESALRVWMFDKVVFDYLNELYKTHTAFPESRRDETTIIITTYAQQIISSMQESFRGGKNIGTSFDTALSDLIVKVSRDVVQFRVKETLEGFQRVSRQEKAVATYQLIEEEYSKRILSMLEDAVESISDYSGITTRKDAFSHIYRGLNDEDKFFLSVAYVLLSQVRELQSQEDPMQEDEAIKKVLSEDGLLIATILQDGLISSEDHWNFAASSSAVEDNLDKYVMDLRAENLSYQQMYRAFESRYNTNRRLLQDVANNFLFTKDEKTAAPLAADYKQAYEMALSQFPETDKLFLLFFEAVNKRVDALKAQGQSETQAINDVLEKEVQRIENIQKIEQERLRAREERLATLRKEIEDLIPEIEKELVQIQTTVTASLPAQADQSQKDAAILSEITNQYKAIDKKIQQRVREINSGTDQETTNILPGQALRRAISELSLQDQIRYQLFPELQKQMEKMTLSNPSASDKFDRALKAAKEGIVERTIAASSTIKAPEITISGGTIQIAANGRNISYQPSSDLAVRSVFPVRVKGKDFFVAIAIKGELNDRNYRILILNEEGQLVDGIGKKVSAQTIAAAEFALESIKGHRKQEKFVELILSKTPEFAIPQGKENATDLAKKMLKGWEKIAASSSLDDASDTISASSKVSKEEYGGINFDPTLMNLQVKRDKNGVPLPLPQQDLKNINIEGLYPVIINIAPVTLANFPLLSKAEEEKQRIPSAKDDLSPIDRQKTLKDRVGKKV